MRGRCHCSVAGFLSAAVCVQPSVMKEISIATGLGFVGAIYWLSVMSEGRENTREFWKHYKV